MPHETSDRAASDGGEVARLSADELKVTHYFPTLIFFSGCSRQRDSERPPDRGHLRRTRTRPKRGEQVELPGVGGLAQPRQAAQGRHVCGIGSTRRRGLGHDVPQARISHVLSTENRHHVVDHQSARRREPGPCPSRVHLERRLLRPGAQEFGSNRVHRSTHP